MLYYMFDATKGDLPSLLSQYDVDVDLTEDGKLKNVNLIKGKGTGPDFHKQFNELCNSKIVMVSPSSFSLYVR